MKAVISTIRVRMFCGVKLLRKLKHHLGHVMRFKDSQEQQQYLKHASSRGNLELVYAGLDVLGSTPWQINRKIFNVVLEVWNAGFRLGKLPPAVYEEPEPQKTPEMETDQKARSIFIQRQRHWLVNKANNHSDRCSVNYKIEIARTVSLSYLLALAISQN
jgi:DNA-directed RNA polymerase, mitochondrial